MEIKVISVDVYQESINPSLIVQADLQYYYGLEFPLSISGTVKIKNFRIASLSEFQLRMNEKLSLTIFENEEQREEVFRQGRKQIYRAYFIADLTSKVIDFIEDSREKSPGKDVGLMFEFYIKRLELPAIPSQTSTRFGTQTFLQLENLFTTDYFVIKHSDWVNKFSQSLGLGHFILIDLNIPDAKKVNDFWVELYTTLAYNLNEMENAIRSGDWPKTMFYARKYYENLKIGDGKPEHKKFEIELRKLFEADQHDEEGINNFLDGIWKFFEFTTKFVHEKNREGKIKPRPIPTKEDAYFVYALGIGLLNIIAKKAEIQP